YPENDILQKIISLNHHSEHPLAQATSQYGKEKNIPVLPVSDFEAVTGKGVTGKLLNSMIALGNEKLMEQVGAVISEKLRQQIQAIQRSGKTVSYLAEGEEVIGYVVIFDRIKATSREAVRKLHEAGLQVIMLTGDNENTAKAVSDALHLDGFKARMLPEDKLNEIKQ